MANSLFNSLTVSNRIPDLCYSRARELFENLQFEEATALLIAEIEKQSDDQESGAQIFDCWLLIAQCHFWGGSFLKAKELCNELNRCTKQSMPTDSWVSMILRCMIAMVSGDYRSCYNSLDEWITLAVNNHNFSLAEPLLFRGTASLRLGKLEKAQDDFESGYALARLQNSGRLQCEHANFLGVCHHNAGNYRQAIEWYRRSYAIVQKLQSMPRIGLSALNLGICHYRLGNYPKAYEYLHAAQSNLQEADDQLNLCRTYIALANVHRLTRNFEQARKDLERAYQTAGELGAVREECLALEFLGDVYRDENQPAEARRYYQRGLALAQSMAPEGDLVLELTRRDGECLVREGQTGAGLEVLARGLSHARKLGDRGEEGVILRCLAEGFLQAQDHREAMTYAQQACTLLEELDARHEHAIARLVAAEIQLRFSKVCEDESPRDLLDQAWEHTVIAQGIILKLDIDHWTEAVKQLQSQIMKRRVEEQKYQAGAVVRSGVVEPSSGKRAKGSISVIIAESRGMREVLQAARAFAPYDESVLLTGETGTGKELVAEILHQYSRRKDRPLISVNIAAIPQSMFEREFFGHARGAFSSADTDSIGLAAAADGGTLFLDEIGELPPEIQVKLLRLLQDGSYHRLGDAKERHADLRVIAATNKDLQKAVADGRFREDLFYRLANLEIDIPPLRERTEDILPLLEHYLSQNEKRVVTIDQYFSPLSQRLLTRHAWPGNVREIIQVARRAFISKQQHGQVEMSLGSGDNMVVVTGSDAMAAAAAAGGQDKGPLGRARLLLALEESDGNRTEAARMLGISRSALYRRLEKFGLD